VDKADTDKFSVVIGGPLYQLWLRSRLVDPPVGLAGRRIIAAVVLTWLPLLAFALIGGTALGGTRVPFLLDPEVHIRLLVALPLFMIAEPVVHQRLAEAVRQFVERGIVRAEDRGRLAAIVDDTARLRNSAAIELALLVCAISVGYWIWRQEFAPRGMDNWSIAVGPLGEEKLTAAGAWYAFVSLGLFRFIMLRWYFRLLLWYLFVWRVSRLPLQLNALHPDRAGGLGFLANTLNAVAPILLAQSVTVAGAIAGQMLFQGMTLQSFYPEIATVVVLLLAMGLLPLAFFFPALTQLGIRARLEYGSLSMRYAEQFRNRWLRGPGRPDEHLLGSPDIQSLADLANASEVVQQLGVLPVGKQAIVRFAILIALPFAPLLLALIPLNELVPRLLHKLI